jgi:P-type Cu+ transporter
MTGPVTAETVTGPVTTIPETTREVQVALVIGGMTCAACAARVQAKLNKVTGVTASVNLSTERAYVTAPGARSARDLIGVVQTAGYTAELTAPAEQDAGAGDDAAVRRLRRRLILALSASSTRSSPRPP